MATASSFADWAHSYSDFLLARSLAKYENVRNSIIGNGGFEAQVKVILEEVSERAKRYQRRLQGFDPLWLKSALENALRAYIALILVWNGLDPSEARKIAPEPEIRLRYKGGKLEVEYIIDGRKSGFIKASALRKMKDQLVDTSSEDVYIDYKRLEMYTKLLADENLVKRAFRKAKSLLDRARRRSTWLLPDSNGGEVGRPTYAITSPVSHLILALLFEFRDIGPIALSTLVDMVWILLPSYVSRREYIYRYVQRLRDKGLVKVKDSDVWLTEAGIAFVLANAKRIASTLQRYVRFNMIVRNVNLRMSQSYLLSQQSTSLRKDNRATEIAQSPFLIFLRKRAQARGRHRDALGDALMRFVLRSIDELGDSFAKRGVLPLGVAVEAARRAFDLTETQTDILEALLAMALKYGNITFSVSEFNRFLEKYKGFTIERETLREVIEMNWKRLVFLDRRKGTIGLWDAGKFILQLVRPSIESAIEEMLKILVRASQDEGFLVELLRSRGVRASCIRDVQDAISELRELERLMREAQ